jgi:hypothetical protein
MEVWLAVSGMLALLGGGAGALAYYRNYTARTQVQGAPGLTVSQTIAANVAKAFASGAISSTTPVATGLTYTQAKAYAANGYVVIGGDAYAAGTNRASAYVPPPPTSVDSAATGPAPGYHAAPPIVVDTAATGPADGYHAAPALVQTPAQLRAAKEAAFGITPAGSQ